jgi:hypothetical protein
MSTPPHSRSDLHGQALMEELRALFREDVEDGWRCSLPPANYCAFCFTVRLCWMNIAKPMFRGWAGPT